LTGIKYVPLLFYAIVIDRSGSTQRIVKQDLAPNNHYIRKYSLQQLIIFIPLFILLIAIVQEIKKAT
jgi:hypothetical protein